MSKTETANDKNETCVSKNIENCTQRSLRLMDRTQNNVPPMVFEDHEEDLNTMCLPHKLNTLDQARMINTARWAQREIKRLREELEATENALVAESDNNAVLANG